jgi:indolepyruvate ferredoxin oxidoreductase
MTDVVQNRRNQPTSDLDAKYRERDGSYYFTGVQALVRVPIDQMRADREAGLNTATFVSGYQGSPLGGYDREIDGRLGSWRPLCEFRRGNALWGAPQVSQTMVGVKATEYPITNLGR